MTSDRAAIAIATLGILLLTVMDAIIKSLSAEFSALQIMYFRNVTGMFFAGLFFLAMKPGWPNREQLRNHALRSSIMLCTGLMFFYALGQIPLAELFVYTFTAPIFVALLGSLLLKERLTGPVVAGLAVGFVGIIAIVATDPAARFGSGSSMGVAAALLSPILYALAMVLLRLHSGNEPVSRIVFLQSLLISSVIVPLAAFTTPLPTGVNLWKVLALGILGTAGNALLATAFKKAEAGKVAVSEYTGLIWAALIGYAFFSETPRMMVWVGAALVITGCLIVARGRTVRQPMAAQDA
ncbi:MAG: DMT family transporter [Methylocystis sp.]|nr:DMT family transporter [Methylocystis sp.]MCA3583633.1 DMT family transporter [Methylocystis sp.]MCA3593280.1 DMT family transporter [Methylocystis sp.]